MCVVITKLTKYNKVTTITNTSIFKSQSKSKQNNINNIFITKH
jgi:hypothetical protein